MGTSRIEQLIEDIYQFVESCKMQTFSSSKVIVPKEELYDLLDELRLRTPDEIKRYQKIIANRDAIIADAEEKASAIMYEADSRANNLLQEHEIMQQAYYKADEIVDNATIEANRIIQMANQDAMQIRDGAFGYTVDMLTSIEHLISNAYDSTKLKYDGLLSSIKDNLDIVVSNKNELLTSPNYEVEEESNNFEEEAAATSNEFEFDENTFLEDSEA